MNRLNPEQQHIAYLIRTDQAYYDYFFRNAKNIEWLKPLHELSFFCPDKISQPDESGRFTYFAPLDYLEAVSANKDVISGRNDRLDLLFEIIKDICQYFTTCKNGNYFLQWKLIEILGNIPNIFIREKISVVDFKKMLSFLLDSEAAGKHVVAECGDILLPKLLSGEQADQPYLDALIFELTALKLSNKKTEEEVIMKYNTFWLRDGFTENKVNLARYCSVDCINGLVGKLRRALEVGSRQIKRVLWNGQEAVMLVIERVPNDEPFTFRDRKFSFYLAVYSANQLRDITPENEYELYRNEVPSDRTEAVVLSDIDNGNNLVDKLIDNVNNYLRFFNNDEVKKKIANDFGDFFNDYSYVWFKSLAVCDDVFERSARDVLIVIVRDVLLERSKSNVDSIESFIKEFCQHKYEYSTLRRMALLLMAKCWKNFSKYFVDFFNSEPRAIFKTDFEVEIFDLLKNHSSDLTGDMCKVLKGQINAIYRYVKDDRQEYIKNYQLRCLEPLKESVYFKAWYNSLFNEIKPKMSLEPTRKSVGGRGVKHNTPMPKDDLAKLSNTDLIQFLKDFKNPDFFSVIEGAPDSEGLASTLKDLANENPDRFISEINSFLSVPYRYIVALVGGIRSAWETGMEFDLILFFNELSKFISNDDFLKRAFSGQGEDSGKGRYIWLIDALCSFIESGCDDKGSPFKENQFDCVDNLFDQMLKVIRPSKKIEFEREAVNYALNTTFGRVSKVYIFYSLRKARAYQYKDKKHIIEWGRQYEEKFMCGIEGYVWFGRFLPNMYFLNKNWAIKTIDLLSLEDAKKLYWEVFMKGYLFGVRSSHKEIYEGMYGNHLKALNNKIKDGRADNRLVQLITLGYLLKYEPLEGKNEYANKSSLFRLMLKQANTDETRERWTEVAQFMWSTTGRTVSKEKQDNEQNIFHQKIREFWQYCADIEELPEILGSEYANFMGTMGGLNIIFDKIHEEECRLIEICVSYVDVNHNASFFIENLTKFSDIADEKTQFNVAQLFLKMLNSTTPTFKVEDIQLIVGRLYKSDNPKIKGMAGDICNIYSRRGLHFLRKIWEDNN